MNIPVIAKDASASDMPSTMFSRFPLLSSMFQLVADLFSKRPEVVPHRHFSQSDVAAYLDVEVRLQRAHSVDDATWHDLDMDDYADSLTMETSIFGRQMLYRRLRGSLTDEQLAPVRQRVSSLLADIHLSAEVSRLCHSLRWTDTETGSLFAEQPALQLPRWSSCIWLLQLAVVGCVAGMWFTPFALFGAIVAIVISGVLQVAYHSTVSEWVAKAKALQRMLAVASAVSGHAADHPNEAIVEFVNLPFSPSKIARALDTSSAGAALPGVGEYLDWFLVDNIRKYYKSVSAYTLHAPAIEACFLKVAALEADLAIARHLACQKQFCFATRTEALTINFDHVIHPMLVDPMPISIQLETESAFISGKNGVGKSTFLRTVGVNLLVANGLGFCYARKATVSTRPLYTSIRNEDSLNGGESLYTAELVRAKQLLDASSISGGIVCLIDEIFRGTNHVESVSAAASVLYAMAAQSMVIVTSHNLVLAPLLHELFRPLCLERDEDERSISVADGLLIEPNGIRLLEVYGFGPVILGRARMVADWFNSYLAEPNDYPDFAKPVSHGNS